MLRLHRIRRLQRTLSRHTNPQARHRCKKRLAVERLEDRRLLATLDFTGFVTSVDAPLFSGAFAVGDPLTMTIDFDASFPDAAPGNPILGDYFSVPPDPADYGAISQLNATVGAYSLHSPDGGIEILDDFIADGPAFPFDQYYAQALSNHGLSGLPVGSYVPVSAEVLLIDETLGAFDSDALPTSLDLDSFPTPANRRFNLLFREPGGSIAAVHGQITQIVNPSPAAVVVLGPADGIPDVVLIEEDATGFVQVSVNNTNVYADQPPDGKLRINGSDDEESVAIIPDASHVLQVDLLDVEAVQIDTSAIDGTDFTVKTGADGFGEISAVDGFDKVELLVITDPTLESISVKGNVLSDDHVFIDDLMLTPTRPDVGTIKYQVETFDVNAVTVDHSTLDGTDFTVKTGADGFGEISAVDGLDKVELLVITDPTLESISVKGNVLSDDRVFIDTLMLTPTRPDVGTIKLQVETFDVNTVTVDHSAVDDTDFTVKTGSDGFGEISAVDGFDKVELLVITDPTLESISVKGNVLSDDRVFIDTLMLTPTRPDVGTIKLQVETFDVNSVTVDHSAVDGTDFTVKTGADGFGEISAVDGFDKVELLVITDPTLESISVKGNVLSDDRVFIDDLMLTPTRPDVGTIKYQVETFDVNSVTVDHSTLDGTDFTVKTGADGFGEISAVDGFDKVELLVITDPTLESISVKGNVLSDDRVFIDDLMLTPTRPDVGTIKYQVETFDVNSVTVDHSAVDDTDFTVKTGADGFGEISAVDGLDKVELLVITDPTLESISVKGNVLSDDRVSIDTPMLMPEDEAIELLVHTGNVDALVVDGSKLHGADFDLTVRADRFRELSVADDFNKVELLVITDPTADDFSIEGDAAADDTVSIDTPMLMPEDEAIELLVHTGNVDAMVVDGSKLHGADFGVKTRADGFSELSAVDDFNKVELLVTTDPTLESISIEGDAAADDTVNVLASDPSRAIQVDLAKTDTVFFSYDSTLTAQDQAPIVHNQTDISSTIESGSWLVSADDSVSTTHLLGATLSSRVSGTFDGKLSLFHTTSGSHSSIEGEGVFNDDVRLEQIGALDSLGNQLHQSLTNFVAHGRITQVISGGHNDDQAVITYQNVDARAGGGLAVDLKSGSDEITINGVPAVPVQVVDSGPAEDLDTLTINGTDEDNHFTVAEGSIEVDGQIVHHDAMERVVIDGQGGTNAVTVVGTPSTPVTWQNAAGIGVTARTLRIVGTDDADQISVNKQGNGTIKVHANFLSSGNFTTFNASDVDQIVAHLGAGDDHMTIAGNVDVPAILLGGAGNDHIKGGGGPSVLIGGVGEDRLVGGKSGDVLIGGRVADDTNDLALLEVLSAWTSNAPYQTRVDAVDALLEVLDDDEQDLLTGGAGRDLLYDGLGDLLKDVKKKKNAETVL